MEHLVLTLWAASHVWALLSSSQPLLLTVFGLLLLMTSAATRVVGGEAGAQENNSSKRVVETPSLSRASGVRMSDTVPESLRHLTQNATAREHAGAEGMYHHV